MGNAMNRGDGLSIAEVSVVESYYTVGMTSESRSLTDDNTASLGGERRRNARNTGRGRLRQETSSVQSSQRTASSLEKPQPQHVPRSPAQKRNYESDEVEESETRTETSSAYHHGYTLQQDDCRDECEEAGIEEEDNGDRYWVGHDNKSPKNVSSPRSIRQNKSNRDDGSHKRNHDPKINGSVHDTTTGSHHQSSILSKDSKMTVSTNRDDIVSVLDIPAAETDMAYAGSDDEEEAQAIREKETTGVHSKGHPKGEEEGLRSPVLSRSVPVDPPQHQESNPIRSGSGEAASESLQHHQRAKLLLQEPATSDATVLREQQAAAQQLLQGEKRRQSHDEELLRQKYHQHVKGQDEDLLRQQDAVSQIVDQGGISLNGSLLRKHQQQQAQLQAHSDLSDSHDESLRWQQHVAAQLLQVKLVESSDHDEALVKQQQARAQSPGDKWELQDKRQHEAHQCFNEGPESFPCDSFSTLTKTLSNFSMYPGEQPLTKKIKEHQETKTRPTPTPHVKAKAPSLDKELLVDEDKPAQRKLEELLMQQQLQEEKLQRQLEQLRVQKERLQKLQEEKKISATPDDHHHGSLNARKEELRIQKERMRAVKADPSQDGSSHHHMTSVESPRREQTRRQRLERARQRVMPKSLKINTCSVIESTDIKAKSVSGNNCKVGKAKSSGNESKVNKAKSESRTENKLSIARTRDNQNSVKSQPENVSKAAPKDTVQAEESSTGTGTGEMDESFPEYEDIPSHFSFNGARIQENDLTTISASLTTYHNDSDDMSTVSSIRDGQALNNNEDDNHHDGLDQTMSSMDEDIDLVFVAKYDKAFNAFLDAYPTLFEKDSDLIQNLKVAKLQRILEASYQVECDLEAELSTPNGVKTDLDAEFQQKLKEGSRLKAERTIQFRSELNQINKQSKVVQAKLLWNMLLLAVERARKLRKLTIELKMKDLTSRHDLLASLPETSLMREVIQVVEAKPQGLFGEKQKKQLQQYQLDNAFLNAEVKVLQQKVSVLKNQARLQKHLDRVLVTMDSKKLKGLKSRFQKSLSSS